jgi:hypothetical protein
MRLSFTSLAGVTSIAASVLLSASAVNAAPAAGTARIGAVSASIAIDYRVVCNRDGDRCRRVWVEDRRAREIELERLRIEQLRRQRSIYAPYGYRRDLPERQGGQER